MADSLKYIIGHAAKHLGHCAKSAEAKANPSGITPVEYERLIGLGMARDWLGWARDLQSSNYSNKKRSKSDRTHSLNELTRFTFMWTATNALFARSAVIELLDSTAPSKKSELDRFRILFQHCGLPRTDARAIEHILHSLLALPMHVKHFPWSSVNKPPTILEVIFFKYTVANEQSRGLGKKLLQAATTNNYEALDLPTLIYATRNWNIHGVLLSSSFRGTRKKFNVWIDHINLALARVLDGSAEALLKAIKVS